jgi:hypothetical protein
MLRRARWGWRGRSGPLDEWRVVSVAVWTRDGPQRAQAAYQLLLQLARPGAPVTAPGVDAEEALDADRHLRARID